MTPDAQNRPVWRASLGALIVAAVLLVTAVLPAEYGFDPTGIGARLGLTGLADPPHAALVAQPAAHGDDRVTFMLEPYESLEYKYVLEEGAGIVFTWTATGTLTHDFHGEPDGATEGFAESFEAGKATASSGAFVAPFAGEHGWFWENRGTEAVTLTLETAGFFRSAIVYRDGYVTPLDTTPDADRTEG